MSINITARNQESLENELKFLFSYITSDSNENVDGWVREMIKSIYEVLGGGTSKRKKFGDKISSISFIPISQRNFKKIPYKYFPKGGFRIVIGVSNRDEVSYEIWWSKESGGGERFVIDIQSPA